MAQDTNAIGQAKRVIASHERFAEAADLDSVMTNVADDIVALVPNKPLIKGSDAYRKFYADLLNLGHWDFIHDYEGAEVINDTVVLHGVARGTLTPVEGEAGSFANNFLLTLREQEDGKYRFWRVAFASSESDSVI